MGSERLFRLAGGTAPASFWTPPTRRVLALVVAGSVALALLCVIAPLAAVAVSALVVLTMAPLGTTVTGRVGALLLIWMAGSRFAYLVAWPASLPPRQAVAWTVAGVAVLVWWAATGRDVRPWQVLGRAGPPALALLAFTATAAWWFWPWHGDVVHVLDRMLLGWDSSGHFAMVEQLRVPQAAAADSFAGYPRGYHSLVASLMELGSRVPKGLDSELVAYSAASLVVVGASLVMLAAFVLDTPALARRPVLLVPVLAALVTLFLQLEDASQVPAFGFGNFIEAVGLAGAGVMVAVRWSHRDDWSRWFLLACAAIGVIGAWPPLLLFLVPVPVAVWLARRPFERGVLRRLASRGAGALLLVALSAFVQGPGTQSIGESSKAHAGPLVALDHFLLLDGAVGTSSFAWPVVFPLAGVAIPLGLVMFGRRAPASLRIAWLWLPAAVGLGTAFIMLGYEVVRAGSPRYYGIKMLCAGTLVAGSVALVASAQAMEGMFTRQVRSRRSTVAVALVTAALLVCTGGPVQLGPLPASPGGTERAYIASAEPDTRAQLSIALRASCEAVVGRPGEYYLLVDGATQADLVRVNVWMITCGLNWGEPDISFVLRDQLPDTRQEGQKVVDIAADTPRILRARPQARVVVSTTDAATARLGLTAAESDRVVTY